MNNKIKLIFGENGKGKSLYYRDKTNDNEYIALNYDVENWYHEERDKNGKVTKCFISQERYLNFEKKERIKNLEKNIYKNKEYFGKVKKELFNNFLKKIDFDNYLKWHEFYKTHNTSISTIKNDIELYISIWEDFDKYKKNIDALSDESFELIKIYITFQFKQIDDLKTKKAKKYHDNILDIKNNIYNEIKHIENIEKILSIKDIEILNKIKNNNFNVEKLTELIKLNIISCIEVTEIFKLMDEIEQNKKNSLKFEWYKENINKYNKNFDKKYQISEDGYSIENIDLSDEMYSNGQRIVHIFEILMNCFANSGKKIILDDVFEKLDSQNSAKLINLLFDEFAKSHYNLELLTHDENFVDLFYKVLDNREDIGRQNIIDEQIYLDNGKPEFKPISLSLTFDGYIKNIYQNALKENNKVDKQHQLHILFAKYFNRRAGINNIFQVLKLENNTYNSIYNITHQIYEFLSENIFHYEENLKENIENYPLIKQYFNDNILLESTDTSSFYDALIEEFKNSNESKFGLSLSNVSNYLTEMLSHINEEKEYFKKNKQAFYEEKEKCEKSNKKFSKYNFYSSMDSRKNNLTNKTKRNELFHNLEYSLTVLNQVIIP